MACKFPLSGIQMDASERMDIFLTSQALWMSTECGGISRHVLLFRSVPCKLGFLGKVCYQEAHQKPLDKKISKYSICIQLCLNGCWLIIFSYPLPDKLAENLTQKRNCVLCKATFHWLATGVVSVDWGLTLLSHFHSVEYPTFYMTRFA